MNHILLGGLVCFIFGTATIATTSAAEPPVDFGRQIRPLLAEKCFSCHGLDGTKRETPLRLDTKDGLFAAVESGGKAVVPRDSANSEVYKRLITDNADEKMPPAKAKQLTPEEIALIKRWIDEGASWKQHWSLVAPVRPALPKVSDLQWPRNEIDHFILARLDQEKLAPSAPVDKISLLRRVTYDLTGLPPTLAEVDAFVADESKEAYEKVVERLLQSPHYGEHLARYWLDAARYGDTHGLHLDNFRQIWPYRDWVVQAFNSNMRFDQFTIEQLAGDLLPNATLEQKIATGFNRCNVTTSEGGAISEEYDVYYTNDRVATMSTVWMGISMGCVTCHEHKFDPFAMKDFYQLYAFFNSLDGPVMDGNVKDSAPVVKVISAAQQAELTTLDAKIKSFAELLAQPNSEVDQAQCEWEAKALSGISPANWKVLTPEKFTSQGGATLQKLADESVLASEKNPDDEVYEIIAKVTGSKITAIRLEGLMHESLPGGGVGRSPNSNVVLTEMEVAVASPAKPDQWQNVKLNRAWADYEQPDGDFKITNAVDGKKQTGWAIGGHLKKETRTAIFVAEKPFGEVVGSLIRIRVKHESVHKQHTFGRIRLSATTAENIPEVGPANIPVDIVKLLQIEAGKRNAEQQAKLREHYRQQITTDAAFVKARTELAAARKGKTDLESSFPTTLIWKEMAKPKPAFVLFRGAYDKPGEPVTRNTPAALPPLGELAAGETPNRLHLAKWLLSAEHPLTARVIVNRYWQQYFGTGIVETSEDFGSQGTPPSHPDLLDWLAVDFREKGWDVQRLQKQIVMSATYQQAAKITPELGKLDPRNRLLARGPRFRFEAEMIRDTALAASGLLNRKLGGPSVKPYQPSGIWEAVGYTDSNTAKFARDSGDALYRRTLYTFWKRTAPPPTMVNFDAPSREACSVRRTRTNTPLAALALMNDEQYVEASRHLARRVLAEGGGDDAARVTYAFRLVTARKPSEAELKVLLDVLQTNASRYKENREAATQLVSVGESKPDSAVDVTQLAAWTMLSNLILNLDEAVTKQ